MASSSSCPSYLSSFAYLVPCALRCSPILTYDQYPPIGCTYWRHCFLLDLPFHVDLPSEDDYHRAHHCVVHHVDYFSGHDAYSPVHLMFELLILLGKSLNGCYKALHLPLQGVREVSELWIGGSHWLHLDHAILCLRSSDMADNSFSQTAPIDDA